MQGGSMRINVGKRIFNEPNGVFRTISVFSEIEPEPEVNQIREYRPNLAEILADAAAEPIVSVCEPLVTVCEPIPTVCEPLVTELPTKPKRIWKPRPNRNKKKVT
jgi:hypothetical protein